MEVFPHIYSFVEVSGALKNLVMGMPSHKLFSTLQTQKKKKKEVQRELKAFIILICLLLCSLMCPCL